VANAYLPELQKKMEEQGLSQKITQKVYEIHSRMPYADRDYTTQEFRDAKKGLLFSSDVSARRSDIDNVTHVIQVGVPANKEQYLARLGRTDAGGGKGVLILHPFEKYFLYQDLKEHPQLERINMRIGWDDSVIQKGELKKATKKCLKSTRRATYSAWLGFYNSIHIRRLRMSKEELVDAANKYATEVLELEEQPAILKNTIKKMGLKDVRGLKILEDEEAAAQGYGEDGEWLEEDMVAETEEQQPGLDGKIITVTKKKNKKASKWDEDESWWAEAQQTWDSYGAKKKSSKKKSEKEYSKAEWAAWEAEWAAQSKDKKKSDRKSKKEKEAENGKNGVTTEEKFVKKEKKGDDSKESGEKYDKKKSEKKSGGVGDKEEKRDKKKDKESEYTDAEWAEWEAKQQEKIAKKAEKEKEKKQEKKAIKKAAQDEAALFADDGDGDDDLAIAAPVEMEKYFDDESGEMKFRPKPRVAAEDTSPKDGSGDAGAGKKKKSAKKEKWAADAEYTEEEWASWEAEKKAKKEAKKAKKGGADAEAAGAGADGSATPATNGVEKASEDAEATA